MGAKFGKPSTFFGSRSEKERLLLVAAAGLALSLFIIFLLVVNFKEGAIAKEDRSSDVSAVIPSAIGTVALLAPERLVRAGSKLSEVRFKEIYWPRNQVPNEAIRDISEVSSHYAKVDLQPGVPIQRSYLTTEIRNMSLPLTPGMRAVSIEVDATSAIEGHTTPGTRVDVVLTYHGEDQQLTSKVIVQNARVLSYGGDITPADKKSPVEGKLAPTLGKTITLEVAPEDALKIATARQMGRLNLIMRAQDDVETVPVTDMDEKQVSDGSGTGRPSRSQECTRGKMRMAGKDYIIGCDGKISEVLNEP